MRGPEQTGGGNVRIAAAAMVLIALASLPARADTRPGDVVREVHTRGNYPSDLEVMPRELVPGEEAGGAPGDEVSSHAPPMPRTPVRLYRSGGSNTPPPTPDEDFQIGGLGAFGEIFGWVLVIVCALLLLGALLYGLSHLRFASSPDAAATPEPNGPADVTLDPLLAMPELSAEELARLGRYREAIHALFVASLLATGFRPEGRSRGATAREIVHAVALGDARRPPLASLLTETELVWFGGREATADAFERARSMHADVLRGAPR